MSYTKRIVCLANSYKTGGLCIAGREITPRGYGGWIRPVSDRPKAELSVGECRYRDRSSPRLLDIIDIAFLRAAPHDHQTENHLIDDSKRWVKRGVMSLLELEKLLEEPASLWTNSHQTESGLLNCVSLKQARMHEGSLHLVEGSNVEVYVTTNRKGTRSYYGAFQLRNHLYKLSITDPEVREYFESCCIGKHSLPYWPDAFLCVSLTEPYEWDKRCHKLIAGVIGPPQS